MSCPAPEQLAAAATEGDDAILAHAAACARCIAALDAQRSTRALVQRTPAVVLTRERREAMAAELMARSDQLPAAPGQPELPPLTRERRDAMAAELLAQADERDASMLAARRTTRRRTVGLVVAGIAAAAAIVIVVALRGGSAQEPVVGAADQRGTGSASPAAGASAVVVTPVGPAEPIGAGEPDTRTPEPLALEPDAPRPSEARPSAKLAGSGDYSREPRAPREARTARDVVRLRGGELTVDSTGSRPVEVVSGGTAIAVNKARVKVIATKGVVSSVAVFAGSAEVTVDGHRVIVEAGTVWERDVVRDDALAAFRAGWTALRAGDNTGAIAAFDRATDPTVAEDAAYWSAIASERAGDTEGAVRRYRELLAKFPATTRATEARAAITRLAP